VADDRILISIDLDSRSVKSGFKKVETDGAKSAKSLSNSFGAAFSGLRSSILGLGAAFTGVFAGRALIRNVTQFQTALAEVDTISNNLSKTNKNLSNELINLSAQFGTSAEEQAKSFYQVISAGITDAVDANKALVAANKLAIGGLTSTEQAIDLLTSTLNSFKETGLDAAEAADILFGTVRLGKTRIDLLASSLGQVLPTAQNLGVRFEDVAAAVAQLTTSGDSTSIAVTKLNAVLSAVLKNQERARKLGPEVAKAFSLQALATKGLDNFLRDLFKSLDGSSERLQELIGRAEGTRAIITLASNDFAGLTDKIDQLKDSTGAADEAFAVIERTLGFQLNKTTSIISALFLRLTTQIGGDLGESLKTFNERLENLALNIDVLKKNLKVFLIELAAVALFIKRQVIFAFFAKNIALANVALSKFILEMRVFGTVVASGGFSLKQLAGIILSTNTAMRALTLSVQVFKGVATLGLAVALDILIRKFFEAQDAGKGFFETLINSGRSSSESEQKLSSLIDRQIELKDSIAKINAEIIALDANIGNRLETTSEALKFKNLEDSLEGYKNELTSVTTEIDKLTAAQARNKKQKPIAPAIAGIDKDALSGALKANQIFQNKLLEITKSRIQAESQLLEFSGQSQEEKFRLITDRILLTQTEYNQKLANARLELFDSGKLTAEQFALVEEQIIKERNAKLAVLSNQAADVLDGTRAKIRQTTAEIQNIVQSGLVRLVSQSIQAFTKAILAGQNAFSQLKSVVLNIFGDILIRMGEAMILTGTAIETLKKSITAFLGGPSIAAGIALVALGSVLKSAAGSALGGSVQGGGTFGGDLGPIPDERANIVEDVQEPATSVNINVEGTVLDPRSVGLQISEILEDTFRSNGVRVVTA
jgi:TP901 family phage tail tape measure protein